MSTPHTTLASIVTAAAAVLACTASFNQPDCSEVIAQASDVSGVAIPEAYHALAKVACEAAASHGQTEFGLVAVGTLTVAWILHFARRK